MCEHINKPLLWRVAAFIDTSRQVDGAFAYRHGPQAFVGGHHGWIGVMDAGGKQLTFETFEEAQAWIDARTFFPAPPPSPREQARRERADADRDFDEDLMPGGFN